MPWCEDCAHYFTPSAMNPDGTCPQCGASLEDQRPVATKTPSIEQRPGEAADSEEDLKTPWHFKLMIVLLILYMIWRLVYWLIL